MCLSSKNINSEKFNLFTFCRARPNIKCHLQVELQLLKASTQAENFSKEYRLNSALIVVILDRTSRQNSSPLRIESVDSSKRMHIFINHWTPRIINFSLTNSLVSFEVFS